jgi:hypothetical protein
MRMLKPKAASGFMNNGFDLERQVRAFFQGFPFILVIKDKLKFHCVCFDEAFQTFDLKCPYCLGTGFIPSVERHRAYNHSNLRTTMLPTLIQVSEESQVGSEYRVFYVLPEATPEENDMVAICDFKSNGLIIPGTMYFFEVGYSDIKRDENGKHIYSRIFCHRDPVDTKIRSFNIQQIQGKIRYFPVFNQGDR